jgi:hypothetical protein
VSCAETTTSVSTYQSIGSGHYFPSVNTAIDVEIIRMLITIVFAHMLGGSEQEYLSLLSKPVGRLRFWLAFQGNAKKVEKIDHKMC